MSVDTPSEVHRSQRAKLTPAAENLRGSRRAFWGKALALILATAGTGGAILSRTKTEQERFYHEYGIETEEELKRILREELGITRIEHASEMQQKAEPEVEALAEGNAADLMSAASEEYIAPVFSQSVGTSVENLTSATASIVEYVTTYQRSKVEVERAKKEETSPRLDCNDDAYTACEHLEQYRLPMYIYSVCPAHWKDVAVKEWHQMAACKLEENYFLIINNRSAAVFWRGSLESFAKNFQEKLGYVNPIPMKPVPGFGIAAYEEPVFRSCWVSKWVVHGTNSFETENTMETAFPKQRTHGMVVGL